MYVIIDGCNARIMAKIWWEVKELFALFIVFESFSRQKFCTTSFLMSNEFYFKADDLK